MPEVTVSGLTKSFGDVRALRSVDFTIADGEFFTLLGPSGCGKSTTLASLAGLEVPDSGTIHSGDTVFVDSEHGVFRPPEARNLGMVFQSYALWPHMTVAQNLAVPLKLRKVGANRRSELINDTLQQVGLDQLADRYSHQLSGGQQQRVALARALVYSPDLLLLDEPLSNLDAKLREQARAWLKGLQQEIGITTIYVTHDQTEALTLSDRIAVMRDGEMLQVGTPEEIYESPAHPQVADFIGRCNFVDATSLEAVAPEEVGSFRIERGDEVVRTVVHRELGADEPVTLGIRSERFRMQPIGDDADPAPANAVAVTVDKALYAGSVHEYVATRSGASMIIEDEALVDPGPAWAVVPETGVYVFDRHEHAASGTRWEAA